MTLEERLRDAEAAYHELMVGRHAVRFEDQNGESVTYSQASMNQLAGYIAGLKRQIAGQRSLTSVRFNTSKGV